MANNRVFALYRDFETAVTVANKLIAGGFNSKDISVVTHDPDNKYAQYVNPDDVKADEGAGFGAVVGTLTGLAVALIPGFGPIVAAGPLAVALMGGVGALTGAATGGLVASLVNFGVSEETAKRYEQVLRTGGAMLVVDTVESEENRVWTILEAHNPIELADETYPQ